MGWLCNTFLKEDGSRYIEVHHIVPLHCGGEDGIWNLSVLCAHHHRMAHFAGLRERKQIEIDLDDGVKVNYPKFGRALKRVAGLS